MQRAEGGAGFGCGGAVHVAQQVAVEGQRLAAEARDGGLEGGAHVGHVAGRQRARRQRRHEPAQLGFAAMREVAAVRLEHDLGRDHRPARGRRHAGGAPEGVIAAAAMRCLGGDFQGVLKFRSDHERERATKMGITDYNRVYGMEDLARGKVMFIATGITNGSYLQGVRYYGGGAHTHSVVMRSETGTLREIRATHKFDTKPRYGW